VHCPVLAAGNALGYLVYAALAEGEAFQIRYLPDNHYEFSFFLGATSPQPERAFSLLYTLSGVGTGQWTEELVYRNPSCTFDDSAIFRLRDSLFRAGNLGSGLPGTVGLHGATSFVTPVGWDSVYTGVLNDPQPPCLHVLTVRVESDWFAFDSEFRYVLQPGDSISAQRGNPIGQVFFVPRETLSLRRGSDEEVAAFGAKVEEYLKIKEGDQVETPYGLSYSPAYAKRMKGAW
jgi:hypothetical protein